MRINQITCFNLLITLILLALMRNSYAAVYVQDFSPQGQVTSTNQVTATFSEDMVKLGATDAAAPFIVNCPVRGIGRWADTKTWRYQLKRDLQSGERCTFALKAQIKSLKQSAFEVGQLPRYEVFTAGPWIANSIEERC